MRKRRTEEDIESDNTAKGIMTFMVLLSGALIVMRFAGMLSWPLWVCLAPVWIIPVALVVAIVGLSVLQIALEAVIIVLRLFGAPEEEEADGSEER